MRPAVVRRTTSVALALATLAASARVAPAQTLLLRTPTISATQVAFVYANNVWVASRSGGDARRLTSFQGPTADPHFSPDGKWIAFSGTYGGNADVYIVPAEGGEPKRLTWHPGADFVTGWSPDGKRVVFTSTRQPVMYGAPRFFSVSVDGGAAEALPIPRGWQGNYSPDGTRFAYRMNNSWDDERRNYRGGQNRPIWVMDMKTHDVVTPPWTDSKDINPVWLGGTVYFLSDRDGVHNVWSWDPASKQLAQVTAFKDYDVKWLDAGGGALVFEQAGAVHVWDAASRRATKLNITVKGDFPWMMPQWKDVTNRVVAVAISPTGKRALVEARGEIFSIPAEKGDVRNLSQSSGSAERAPSWSPDGKTVAYFSDKSGEYKLVLEPQDGVSGKREIALPDPTFFYTPTWSPDGKKLAYSDTHLRLWVLDVATGKAVQVDEDRFMDPDRSLNPSWSPDSKWLAYSRRLPSKFRAIFVWNVDGGAPKQLTDGMSDATWPTWDLGGKLLYFAASTNFGLNSGWLDMSRYEKSATRSLYALVLRQADPNPLAPESDDETTGAVLTSGDDDAKPAPAPANPRGAAAAANAAQPAASARGDSARGPQKAPVVAIDFSGVNERILSLGLAARDYRDLRAGAAGTLFFIENVPATGTAEVPGGQGQGGPPGGTLHKFTVRERKANVFASNIAQFAVSADRKKVLLRTPGAQGGLQIVDADRAPTPGQGRLAATLRMWLDPKAEFRQMFEEGWRNQKHYLYVKNLQGVDHKKVHDMYVVFVDHVRHREDLNFLLDWTGAEIAIGHSYVRGGDIPETPNANGGLLGADYAIANGRYRIARIYTGENWNPDLRAPLAGPGIDARVGDYVMAVNGTELTAADDIQRLLEGTANRQTVLLLNATPSMQGARRVTVVPVPNDGALRTRAWVENNRRIVDSLSKGKLAYVHLPNTAQPGYEALNRYYFAQQDRQGVIVDERFNGGGSLADYIIEVLQRQMDGYFNNPVSDRTPYTSPAAGIWGPKVMIINEMAGSGGDAMPYMFKRRKIGMLVGMRTWGGLVGTWDTPVLVDGGTMIAPRGGFFDLDGKCDPGAAVAVIEVESEGLNHRGTEAQRAARRAVMVGARAPSVGGRAPILLVVLARLRASAPRWWAVGRGSPFRAAPSPGEISRQLFPPSRSRRPCKR
ncbi:MAG: PD40 domain-containing protein [Gemmatimonadetes bacterium]|nr:PD40 domain-containing protein [Gemmatimonadota bacterium]